MADSEKPGAAARVSARLTGPAKSVDHETLPEFLVREDECLTELQQSLKRSRDLSESPRKIEEPRGEQEAAADPDAEDQAAEEVVNADLRAFTKTSPSSSPKRTPTRSVASAREHPERRWPPMRRSMIEQAGVLVAHGLHHVDAVEEGEPRDANYLQVVAAGAPVCTSVLRLRDPIAQKPVVNDSFLLVNQTYVPSGDVHISAFSSLDAVIEDYDITVLHSVAYPSEYGAFKAAVLQIIAWFAKTTILAWNLMWKYSLNAASERMHSSDVQICRARFVGKRRVKAARSFWVDRMHRAARYSDNLIKQQLFEPCAGSFDNQPRLPFVYRGGGRKPSARKRKEQIIFDGLCKLLQAVSEEPESDPEEAPSDPGDRLLESLQGIVRQAKANGTSGLIQKVKALVASFEQEQRNDKPRPGMRVTFAESETSARNQSAALTPSVERKVQVAGAPQHANARPASQAGPKATEAPKRPAPVIAGKLCPEWCNSKEIRLKDLQSLLNEGSEPSGEFCLATVSKVTELVMLAQTHGLTAKCALLIPAHCKDDMDKKLSATHMWVKIVGKGWIKCTAVPLTSSGLPTWPSPAQVTVGEKDSVDAPVQLTVRITTPKRFVTATLWQDLLKKPNKVLADFLPAGAFARSYGWKVKEDKLDSLLVGYLKIPQEHVKTLLDVSGQWGLFFNQVAPALATELPVSWIKPSEKDLDPREYLKEALVKANASKTCLAFRTGGGSSLGLRGVAPSEGPRRWSLQSVPKHWGPDTVKQFLEKQGWQDVAQLQSPKYKSGKWTALATAPQLYKSQEKLIYTVGNVDMIISLWRKAPRNFHEEHLAVSQSWFESSKAPEPDADMETGVVTPTHKEAPPTVLDSTQESPEPEVQGNKRKQESPAKKTRTKIAACLANDKSFQQTWFADAGATVDTEAGNPATTWQEYIETVKRPHKWADSWMIQAAAVVLKTEVHVFKWCRRMDISPEWIRFWQTEEHLLKLAWVSCLFTRNWPCPVCKVVLTAKGSSEKAVNAKLGEMRWAKEQAIEKHRKACEVEYDS
ncbi:unnamed protein product [Symbiodinium necroappetens]|uniref:Uncharacterized protein n=1 Tax=Symbiodinium necroappetens TaxID=1628268 RepID=A0A812M3M0_9DINO|nr:unnamed protein product [Symbiodinium necroappetens]